MQDLIKQEQFELEVLDKLNSKKLLNSLVFCGGTMLRLCFGLNRFSVDMDFWIVKEIDNNSLFKELKNCLGIFYYLKDSANKYNTLLYELKSKSYPRSLKIEIRKETSTIPPRDLRPSAKKIKTEQVIAYSKYSNKQVFLRVVSLANMMEAKSNAFLERKEIRDIFDMEFLFKKGMPLDFSTKTLREILDGIDALTRKDYTVKLGSLLETEQRKYYVTENFKILKLAIQEKLR